MWERKVRERVGGHPSLDTANRALWTEGKKPVVKYHERKSLQKECEKENVPLSMTRRFCKRKCTQRNIAKHNVRLISRWTIRQGKSGAEWKVYLEYNVKKKVFSYVKILLKVLKLSTHFPHHSCLKSCIENHLGDLGLDCFDHPEQPSNLLKHSEYLKGILMEFQTCVTFFLLWNTKENILKNVWLFMSIQWKYMGSKITSDSLFYCMSKKLWDTINIIPLTSAYKKRFNIKMIMC